MNEDIIEDAVDHVMEQIDLEVFEGVDIQQYWRDFFQYHPRVARHIIRHSLDDPPLIARLPVFEDSEWEIIDEERAHIRLSPGYDMFVTIDLKSVGLGYWKSAVEVSKMEGSVMWHAKMGESPFEAVEKGVIAIKHELNRLWDHTSQLHGEMVDVREG